MEKYKSDEKRQFRRFFRKEPVEILFKDAGQFTGSLSGDISGGGVRVYLNDFIPLNTEVTLEIRLEDERIVHSTGRIVWVRKNRFNDNYQAGLEFTGDQSVARVQNIISVFLQTHQS